MQSVKIWELFEQKSIYIFIDAHACICIAADNEAFVNRQKLYT